MQRICLIPVLLAALTGLHPSALATDVVVDTTVAPVTSPALSDALDRRFATVPSILFTRVRDCRLALPPRAHLVAPATLSLPAAAAASGLVPVLRNWLRLI